MRPASPVQPRDRRARATRDASQRAKGARPDPTDFPFAWFIAEAAAADAEGLRDYADCLDLWTNCRRRGCGRAERCRGPLAVDRTFTGERMPTCVARHIEELADGAMPYFRTCILFRFRNITGQPFRDLWQRYCVNVRRRGGPPASAPYSSGSVVKNSG